MWVYANVCYCFSAGACSESTILWLIFIICFHSVRLFKHGVDQNIVLPVSLLPKTLFV